MDQGVCNHDNDKTRHGSASGRGSGTPHPNARQVMARLSEERAVEHADQSDSQRRLTQCQKHRDRKPSTRAESLWNRARIDSIAFHRLSKKYFRHAGHGGSWGEPTPRITDSERELLSGVGRQTVAMPPGTIPNPTKKKIRPSSAAANIQTHKSYTTALYDNVRPSTAAVTSERTPHGGSTGTQRPVTHAGGPRYGGWGRSNQDILGLEHKLQRRLTVGAVDGLADTDAALRPGALRPNIGSLLKEKIEEKISIDTLEELKKAFHAADSDGSGKLELDEFKMLLCSQLNIPPSKEPQIDALFHKIDWSSEGAITWDEFCTYMQLEYAEKEDSYLRAKEVSFTLPAKTESMPHREEVVRITDTSDGMFVVGSKDGTVSFWSGNVDHKRNRSVVTAEQVNRQKPKWITDFVIMPHYNKFIVGTGDREIQFFELSSFEPYCQISGLETVPLKLDYCSTGHDECMILYGDSQGCINIIVINSAGECLRTWKKMPKTEGIASVGIEAVAGGPNTKFIRWKVHGDWVQQLKYYDEIRQVISCSNHANTALVIGCTVGSTHVEQQLKEMKDPKASDDKTKLKYQYAYANVKPRLEADQTVFKVYKGVKTFHFSKDKNVLVTGGMDRIVRIWNPYVPGKPTGMLRGHNAPIFYLFIAEDENRIFTISTDKIIKVWDIQDQNCLLTVRPKGHKIKNDLQSCYYSNVSKSLAIATDHLNGLPLKLKPSLHADIVITHKEPIHACIYNPNFKQVITCSDGSVIKLWDFETGNAIFEFGEAHGESAITCLAFDTTGRRLITGARDGQQKIWNYNNGHCLRIFEKEDGNDEVCAITYVEMNRNRYVVSVGWDKHINIYPDDADGSIHHIQHPLPKWPDDEMGNGHREDILSVAQCPPNLLATSSYDGEVIVWNMVSGHIFCHLRAAPPAGYEDQTLDGDLSINKLQFLKARAAKKDSATLVAGGPRGHIHFWNVFQGGTLMAQFPGSRMKGAMISGMEVDKVSHTLYTADSYGFVFVWNIKDYCLNYCHEDPPELLTTWRAHIEIVTCMNLVEERKMILTSSLDCTVRLWTTDGHYVGTFGQQDPWDVYNRSTFQHPMVPYDVLVDPLSLPSHPIMTEKQNGQPTNQEETSSESEEEEEETVDGKTPTPSTVQFYTQQQFFVDDDTIAEQLKDKPYDKSIPGKRLRHEKMKPIRIDRGGPSEYQMLLTYKLEDTPQPKAPTLKVSKGDPFNFYAD